LTFGVEKAESSDDVYRVADFLTLHLPNTPDTKGWLDAEALAILAHLRDGKRLSEAVERVDWRETSGEQAAERVQAWFALWSSLGWFCKST